MLKDLLAEDLTLVICGSAAGLQSAERGEYYAGRGNVFWHTLAAVHLTTRELAPAEYSELLKIGIGLTDLVRDYAGPDHGLRFSNAHRDELCKRILHYRPAYLCFNGKTAAKAFLSRKRIVYGLQSEQVGTTAVFVAPSTSGAARRWWSIEPWREIAAYASCRRATV